MQRGYTICDAIHNSIGILDDYSAGLSTKEEVEDAIKSIGYEWLKSVETENMLVAKLKRDKGMSDEDWSQFIPIFVRARCRADKKWNRSFDR